jgi:hypothetical protein
VADILLWFVMYYIKTNSSSGFARSEKFDRLEFPFMRKSHLAKR